jgi:hypothetical protein
MTVRFALQYLAKDITIREQAGGYRGTRQVRMVPQTYIRSLKTIR